MSDENGLDTYLNNHLAGGAGAIEMAEHGQAANDGEPLAQFLAELVVEVQADHQTLQDLISSLGVTQSPLKKVAARMGEKVTHLKLGSGNMGNLLALEALSLGVEGKACLWKSLKQVHDGRTAFALLDFDALIRRAEDQRSAVEQWAPGGRRHRFGEKTAA